MDTESMESAQGFLFMVQRLPDWITIDILWKVSTILLLLLNLKVFPFVYHLRILNGVRFLLRSQRPKEPIQLEHIFQPLITSSKACLMEIDVFGHKSNSTYFADLDIARVHLVTTMFGKGIEAIRGGTTMNGLSKTPHSKFTLALGAVSCTFKKELLPYETYDMWTRILSWDEKWLYIVTHFVKKGSAIHPRRSSLYPEQSGRNSQTVDQDIIESKNTESAATASGAAQYPIAASAMSKVVFKNGRRTIKPSEMIAASGLSRGGDKSTLDGSEEQGAKSAQACEDAVEKERERGLRLASMLANQTELEKEFDADVALGRHHDGFGIEGVVATLAQLGKISNFQLV